MRESEREMSETGRDAAGRNYSAMNYVGGTRQRVLFRPCPPGWREGSSGPTSFILRNCPRPSTQSSRFTASSITKCGCCDGSSQHAEQAEDERGPCVRITICNPCREAGQLAQRNAYVAGSSQSYARSQRKTQTGNSSHQKAGMKRWVMLALTQARKKQSMLGILHGTTRHCHPGVRLCLNNRG